LQRQKLILQSISATANKLNCKILLHELCEEFAIGLDETANHLKKKQALLTIPQNFFIEGKTMAKGKIITNY
jgi:hypothetical protein